MILHFSPQNSVLNVGKYLIINDYFFIKAKLKKKVRIKFFAFFLKKVFRTQADTLIIIIINFY